MLGRTHMAIGALGALIATPLLMHGAFVPLSHEISHVNLATLPKLPPLKGFASEGIIVAASIVGSIMPDLDHPDSLASRRVERIGKIAIALTIVAFIILLHLAADFTPWVVGVCLYLALSSDQTNMSRRFPMLILAVMGIVFAAHGHISWSSDIWLTVWILGAMYTPHRTFTHSLLGIVTFGIAVISILAKYHLMIVADGLILGYALHMAADSIAGGVPLLWPWAKRQGIRLVQTSSIIDHLIGGIAALAFVGLAVL